MQPDFATFHRVHIQYCDGGSFAGDHRLRTAEGTLHFRGRRILRATIERLRSFGLGATPGTEVLLTGCSAGGLGVYLNADFIRGLLPPTVSKFKAMAGSGFMLDHPNADGVDVIGQQMAAVYHMQRLESASSPACLSEQVSAQERWRCILAEQAARFIESDLFILDSSIDEWQLLCTLTAQPAGNATLYMDRCGALWPCLSSGWGSPLAGCSATQLRAVQAYGSAFVARIRATATMEKPRNGGFISSCHTHVRRARGPNLHAGTHPARVTPHVSAQAALLGRPSSLPVSPPRSRQ